MGTSDSEIPHNLSFDYTQDKLLRQAFDRTHAEVSGQAL